MNKLTGFNTVLFLFVEGYDEKLFIFSRLCLLADDVHERGVFSYQLMVVVAPQILNFFFEKITPFSRFILLVTP